MWLFFLTSGRGRVNTREVTTLACFTLYEFRARQMRACENGFSCLPFSARKLIRRTASAANSRTSLLAMASPSPTNTNKPLSFQPYHRVSSKSAELFRLDELSKLSWRSGSETLELICGTGKITLTKEQALACIEFFVYAKTKFQEFLRVGSFRTELLEIGSQLQYGVFVKCVADEHTDKLKWMVSANDTSIVVESRVIDSMIAAQHRIAAIKVKQDYQLSDKYQVEEEKEGIAKEEKKKRQSSKAKKETENEAIKAAKQEMIERREEALREAARQDAEKKEAAQLEAAAKQEAAKKEAAAKQVVIRLAEQVRREEAMRREEANRERAAKRECEMKQQRSAKRDRTSAEKPTAIVEAYLGVGELLLPPPPSAQSREPLLGKLF